MASEEQPPASSPPHSSSSSSHPSHLEQVYDDPLAKNPRFQSVAKRACDNHLEDVIVNATDSNVSWGTWRRSVSAFFKCTATPDGQALPPRTRSEDW